MKKAIAELAMQKSSPRGEGRRICKGGRNGKEDVSGGKGAEDPSSCGAEQRSQG